MYVFACRRVLCCFTGVVLKRIMLAAIVVVCVWLVKGKLSKCWCLPTRNLCFFFPWYQIRRFDMSVNGCFVKDVFVIRTNHCCKIRTFVMIGSIWLLSFHGENLDNECTQVSRVMCTVAKLCNGNNLCFKDFMTDIVNSCVQMFTWWSLLIWMWSYLVLSHAILYEYHYPPL